MHTIYLAMFAIALGLAGCATAVVDVAPTRGLDNVQSDHVTLEGGFWGPRLKTHHEVTVPHALDRLEQAGHVTNFDKAAGVFDGPLKGHHAFDSDVHKALEGAMYSLQHREDPKLHKLADSMIDRILAAQQDDGFLISCYIVKDSDKRWDTMRLEHQLYNAGHFFEMAVEHHRLTGDTKALDAAKRFADCIAGVFGEGKRYDVGGHEGIELALVKLYRATGERKYLELSRFFIDERGHAHGTERKPFDHVAHVAKATAQLPKFKPPVTQDQRREFRRARNSIRNGRMQDHKPLIEQDAIGHAVRAGYIYSAMADMARFMDAPQYEKGVDRIWQDVVTRKMYVNGGIGTAQYHDEGFGDPYLLPNRTYCESCAGIAHVLWQHRMALLKSEAKYADVMELALYNAGISGISIEGNAFFYQNPLESRGAKRSTWIGLACCPTNLTRFIPQVGGLAYAKGDDNITVNLYAAGTASIDLDATTVAIAQETNYPWDGEVKLTVTPKRPAEFTLRLRIPGWALGKPVPSDLYHVKDRPVKEEPAPVTLTVDGKTVSAAPQADGYVHLKRRWQGGEVIQLALPMPITRVYAHEKIEACTGKVTLMRGPVVYCVEAADNKDVKSVLGLTLAPKANLKAEHRKDLLGGLTVITGSALDDKKSAVAMTAIPYYAWANRDKGAMTVWLKEAQE